MTISDIITDSMTTAELWAGKYKIPWDDPDFSRRMLAMHLTQEHDWASRKFTTIDDHVAWLHREILNERPSRILDLGCGPGLYAERFAALGHRVHGIDFSPASIDHARTHTKYPEACEYTHGDLRSAPFGDQFDFAGMIYGEFNAFTRDEILQILKKAHDGLKEGGVFVAEGHTPEEIERFGRSGNSWYGVESGLFSDNPHLCLTANVWHERDRVTETRFYVVDAKSGEITP